MKKKEAKKSTLESKFSESGEMRLDMGQNRIELGIHLRRGEKNPKEEKRQNGQKIYSDGERWLAIVMKKALCHFCSMAHSFPLDY